MFGLRQKLFSQNFLHDQELIKKLIVDSSIVKNDTVIEIGPGKWKRLAKDNNFSIHPKPTDLSFQWLAIFNLLQKMNK